MAEITYTGRRTSRFHPKLQKNPQTICFSEKLSILLQTTKAKSSKTTERILYGNNKFDKRRGFKTLESI